MTEIEPKIEKPVLSVRDSVQSPFGLITKNDLIIYGKKYEFYVNPNIMDEEKIYDYEEANRYLDILTVSRLPGFRKQYEQKNTTVEKEISKGRAHLLESINSKMPLSDLKDHTLYPIIIQSVLKDLFSTYKTLSSK